jgi:3-phenylpropionate/trans-cinnamate dioxygenase ferredoxin subunit
VAWHDVCAASEVEPDRINAFDVGPRRVLLFATPSGLKAFDGICTHETADLGLGFLTAGRITCPLHLSQFDIETGQALNPPAEEPLARYPVKEEGGRVFVEVPE